MPRFLSRLASRLAPVRPGFPALAAGSVAFFAYQWVVATLGVAAGPAELLGGLLMAVSAGLNVARWVLHRGGDERRERWAAWGLRAALPGLNLLLAVYAAAELAGDLRAGRNAVGAAVLAAWSVGPAALAVVRLSRWLAATWVPAGGVGEKLVADGPGLPAAPLAPFLPTDGH